MSKIGPGFIYFIKPAGMYGPIKIGFSRRPPSRVMALSVWSPFPLEIVTSCAGTLQLERNIHDCLWASHSHREWFHPTSSVMKVIEGLGRGVAIETVLDLSDRSQAKDRVIRRATGPWSEAKKQAALICRRQTREYRAKMALRAATAVKAADPAQAAAE